VTIDGTAVHNEILAANVETIVDEDGLGAFNYQWFRNGNALEGENDATYVLSTEDVRKKISVQVSFADGQGTGETLESEPTIAIQWADLKLVGEKGGDDLVGSGGDDALVGKRGDDVLYGKRGNDVLDGGLGDDTLRGAAGKDLLNGGGGSDILLGGRGSDALLGGSGRDFLNGRKGNDVLTGGSHADRFFFNKNSGKDVITDFEIGVDSVQIGKGAKRFEQLTFEGIGSDVIMKFKSTEVTFEETHLEDLLSSDVFVF
jgi:Ca2+-binding RTX toxin-like protein